MIFTKFHQQRNAINQIKFKIVQVVSSNHRKKHHLNNGLIITMSCNRSIWIKNRHIPGSSWKFMNSNCLPLDQKAAFCWSKGCISSQESRKQLFVDPRAAFHQRKTTPIILYILLHCRISPFLYLLPRALCLSLSY